jgi:hypothetical protein
METGNPVEYWNSLSGAETRTGTPDFLGGVEAYWVKLGPKGDEVIGDTQRMFMGDEGDNRSAESLASEIVPYFKAVMPAKLREVRVGDTDYDVTPFTGQIKQGIASNSHRLFTMNIMRQNALVAAVGAGSSGVSVGTSRGEALRNHVVASVALNDYFYFFDPNWGQFTVALGNRNRLIDAWWSDTERPPPSMKGGFGYAGYNEVNIIASAVSSTVTN